MTKKYSFSNIRFIDLKTLVNIRQVADETVFQDWFQFAYPYHQDEEQFLQELIDTNRLYVLSYSEEELKIKFIGPLLNKVHYQFDDVQDWYQRPLKAKINQAVLHGYVDFMVAKGFKEPERPYFFIQEFKKTKIDIDPEDQLLAEMLVAMTLNPCDRMHGAYIIGQEWRFVILRRTALNTYEYYVSLIFDCLHFESLCEIYKNLQAVKSLFCHE